jgi:hypothetical protein
MPDLPVGANAEADGMNVALNQFNMLVSRFTLLVRPTT